MNELKHLLGQDVSLHVPSLLTSEDALKFAHEASHQFACRPVAENKLGWLPRRLLRYDDKALVHSIEQLDVRLVRLDQSFIGILKKVND